MTMTYKQFVMYLEARTPPNEFKQALMEHKINLALTKLHDDLLKYNLTMDECETGVSAKFSEFQVEEDADGGSPFFATPIVVVKTIPGVRSLVLGRTTIGKAPGWYNIIAVWESGIVMVHITHVPTPLADF